MIKRKEVNSVTNKIVNINQVLGRGQRVPLIELEFKENGFNKQCGHKVYIDYNCAKELLNKINNNIDLMQSKYFANEYYEKLTRPKAEKFL